MAPTLRSKGKPVGSPPSEDYAPDAEILEETKLGMVDEGSNTSTVVSDNVDFYQMMPVGAEKNEVYTVPLHMYQKLKAHQKDGLTWLWKIHCNEIPGGIVADDMGLGKTLQTVTFLAGLLCSGIIHMALIISPVSILDSWQKELKNVGLDHRSYIYGTSDGSLETVLEKGGILLTSYEMYTKQNETLGSQDKKWDYVVLDEAHRIKNLDAHVTRTMYNIHCGKKILMTGTPLARDLEDIYALINFIEPDLLGSKAMFQKNYMSAVDLGQYSNSRKSHKEKYLKALARCRKMISPYMLRRNKMVLIETGELICKKSELIVWLKLTDIQIELYKQLYKLYGPEANFRPQDEKQSFPLSTLSRLISIDPCLLLKTWGEEGKKKTQVRRMAGNLLRSTGIDEASYQDIRNSCKMSFVVDLIDNILCEDRKEEKKEKRRGEHRGKRIKILVFSQHMHVLDIIEKYLEAKMTGVGLIRIDGSVPKARRDAKIEEFNLEEGPTIFLLSARVGGEGLNLVAATRVIIIDPAWNVSDDNQISDRVYRMGQKKDVVIYRLFTCGTIEEHMFKLQLIKGIIAHALIEGKICASLVRKEEGNVLVLPKSFEHSKICNSLKREFGDNVELDRKHQTFLRTHRLVKGITDQKLVFSKSKSLSDVPLDESSEDETSVQKQKCAESAIETDKLSKSVVPWDGRLRRQCSVENATTKQEDAESTIVVQETMQIPADKVGILCGEGGSTIKEIRIKSSTIIEVIDHKKDHRNGPHRAVKIIGTRKEIVRAQQLITNVITNVDRTKDLSPVKTVCVSIPKDMVGRIIGKGGETVNSMMKKSGANIKVIGTESKCQLTGSAQSIESAQSLISDIIKKAQKVVDSPRRTLRGSGVPAPPRNHPPVFQSRPWRPPGDFQQPRIRMPLHVNQASIQPLPPGDFQQPRIRMPLHVNQASIQPLRPRHPWQPSFGVQPAQYVRPPECGARPPPYGDQGPPPH